MKNLCWLTVTLSSLIFLSCSSSQRIVLPTANKEGAVLKSTVVLKERIAPKTINTKYVSADEAVAFAETLRGTPYKYGSAAKEQGFDCSGFVYYVFSRYQIAVPRTSKDFTNAGQQVSNLECRRGDIVLFTGSDLNSGVVGHMGFITRNDKGVLQFIHASSGKGGGVMISTMNSYFMPRFVKIIRVFKEA